MSSCRGFGWAVVASTVLSTLTSAEARADEGGGLVGWVESTRGAPVAGALVSIFGKGIRGGSLVTLADSQGQFVLPSLPPGSYTLRAIGSGHEPSAARHVTVLPNRDALYTLSLTPVGEKPTAALAAEDEQGLEPGRVALAGAAQAPLGARDRGAGSAGGGRRARARARHDGAARARSLRRQRGAGGHRRPARRRFRRGRPGVPGRNGLAPAAGPPDRGRRAGPSAA